MLGDEVARAGVEGSSKEGAEEEVVDWCEGVGVFGEGVVES